MNGDNVFLVDLNQFETTEAVVTAGGYRDPNPSIISKNFPYRKPIANGQRCIFLEKLFSIKYFWEIANFANENCLLLPSYEHALVFGVKYPKEQ